jgi:predicted  nucleic acid-binding Zn-ribbon protein
MALETEVQVLKSVVSKLDTSIEKIAQVSNDIGKILAVHEQRLDNIEKVADQRQDEMKDLHSRITTGNREIVEKISDMEQRLEIKMRENGIAAKEQHKAIQEEIQKDITAIGDKVTTIDNRVDALERWKWWLMGAAASVGFIIGNLTDIVKLLAK